MSDFRLQFDPVWSWPVTILIVLLCGLVIWWGYRLAKGISTVRKRILLGIRLLTVLVLLVGMLRPQLEWVEEDGQESQVWIVADASRSMSIADGTGGMTRRDTLLQSVAAVEDQLSEMTEAVEVQQFDFDEQLRRIDEFDDSTAGQQTALGAVLREAITSHAQKPVTSIFLLTDGAQRATPPRDIDPLLASQELGELGISLYPVPIGQAASTADAADVAIDEITVDPVVFVKKRVPVRVNVRWNGAGGQRLRLRLLLEDRTGLKATESGELKPIAQDKFNQTDLVFETRYPTGSEVVELAFTPEIAGEYKLAAEVEQLESEVQVRNNRRQALVTIRQGGLRVAYFDIFRTEVKSIRQLNASDKIQVDFQMLRPAAFTGDQTLDPTWFESGRYDVYILGDVPAAWLGQENLQTLATRVREGAGLLMLGGYHTYGAGGYASTALEDLLPVELKREDYQPIEAYNESLQINANLNLVPTAAGNRHYVTRIDNPARNDEAWTELPPLTGATRIRAKSDFVEVLARSEQGDHLIVAAETGLSRIVCLAFDQTYLWAQAGFETAHRRFWRQLTLWLAHKELDTDQPVWVNISPKASDPGGRISLEYGARNDQGEAISDGDFRVTITDPAGNEQLVQGSPTDLGRLATFGDTSLPGDYFVNVQATRNGASLGFAANARFLINDRDLELDNPVVDRALLEEMTQLAGLTTDSQVIDPESMPQFLSDFLERKPWESGLEVTSVIRLWDNWPFLLIFAGLMTLEWFVRKKSGLI